MMMTDVRRIERLKKGLREFLMNDKDTQDLFIKKSKYYLTIGGDVTENSLYQHFIANICEVVVNSIGSFEPTYILTEHYLDISYLDVYITPKKFIIINLDEVWKLSKKLVAKY